MFHNRHPTLLCYSPIFAAIDIGTLRTGAREVNIPGKVKNLFLLVTIDVYKLENRKNRSLPRLGWWGDPWGVGGPLGASSFINSS